MTQLYFDEDADLRFLDGETIALIGYGNQGRSQALNMRDSGLQPVVGVPTDRSAKAAEKDGFEVLTTPDAVRRANVLLLLIPDEVMPAVYSEQIAPYLQPGAILSFASGYNITFQLISPPDDIDAVLVAPRMIGKGVRDTFLRGEGFPSLIAIHQDASGQALERTLAIAKAIGSTKSVAILSSFDEETALDLFSEHVGSLYLARLKFEVLTEAGFTPEAVLLELYASGETAEVYRAARDIGLWNQLRLHSRTSQYGQQITALKHLDSEAIRKNFRDVISHIRSGVFAKEWQEEQELGFPELKSKTSENLKHPMQTVENNLYRIIGRRNTDITSGTWLQEDLPES